ncbi:DEAD/DEAH box helicase [Lipingzhangella sp. LS1_29]|uniref:DEAD/DEAH box helicase n=1 Tax=Lipingzhangella rawalii TaxID=2055835 RepID=A0ABU2H6Z6_9ACTN|nr:DEAD/DEAH box helicase [Lipingzhangella rawalii]MDS1270752.1 DEAD/DEAH box helicase [Lipingzhangella rawalii]
MSPSTCDTAVSVDAPQELHPSLVHHIVNTLEWPSLRPLQRDAVAPLLAGEDAVLLAPTAGGKTEAAVFPLLTAMERDRWEGLSVLYLCPLKALLNNVLPRLQTYTSWLGRSAAVWHGDVTESARRRVRTTPPDVLLTTPESLEGMLVSTNTDHHRLFAGLRAVVVDEVHSFAADDRGWHLLAVLERLHRLAGAPLQRVGLSATVGNPAELLTWLQGSGRDARPGRVVAPDIALPRPVPNHDEPPPGDIELDYVGSTQNAATVIAALHRGEKRLVFCDSRTVVEELGAALRAKGVTTFLSHASLPLDDRRRAEAAFAEARDCVIVATSTLELGIDVGDLDRVIQIDAPASVASFLQRLGRTGRRGDTVRNCLFLTRSHGALLSAAGLMHLWGQHFVEPVQPPPEPRHIAAQQLLALSLQENTVGRALWPEAWNGLAPFDTSAQPILRHLEDEGFLERDGEMLFLGPAAERRYGRRNFMDLTAVFTAPPQFTALWGRTEVGRTDPLLLIEQVQGPRVLLLGGRSWEVTWIDWSRRRCQVQPTDLPGKAHWHTYSLGGASFALTRATREILLGAEPPVRLTQRATSHLAKAREEYATTVHSGASVIARTGTDVVWWTWGGFAANATLAASLSALADERQRFTDTHLRLRADLTPDMWRAGTADAGERLCLPQVDERAVSGLKFSDALPVRLAEATLAQRLANLDGAQLLLREPQVFNIEAG